MTPDSTAHDAQNVNLRPRDIVLYRAAPDSPPWMTSVVAVRPGGRNVIELDGGEDGPFSVLDFSHIQRVEPRDLIDELMALREKCDPPSARTEQGVDLSRRPFIIGDEDRMRLHRAMLPMSDGRFSKIIDIVEDIVDIALRSRLSPGSEATDEELALKLQTSEYGSGIAPTAAHLYPEVDAHTVRMIAESGYLDGLRAARRPVSGGEATDDEIIEEAYRCYPTRDEDADAVAFEKGATWMRDRGAARRSDCLFCSAGGGADHDCETVRRIVSASERRFRARRSVSATPDAPYPKAEGNDALGGWTIKPSFLDDVRNRAVVCEDECAPSWETTEGIILAYLALRGAPGGGVPADAEPWSMSYADSTRLCDEFHAGADVSMATVCSATKHVEAAVRLGIVAPARALPVPMLAEER